MDRTVVYTVYGVYGPPTHFGEKQNQKTCHVHDIALWNQILPNVIIPCILACPTMVENDQAVPICGSFGWIVGFHIHLYSARWVY